ncbi:MAG: transglutaminase family protein [Verrucomicrobiaceae bacterium]|nr:MAG: transglutaminase family protein [Verrucomicrobiaceae bacterium]
MTDPSPSIMNFQISCELEYTLSGPANFLFSLRCIETPEQQIQSESLVTEPPFAIEEFSISGGMNRFSRLNTTDPGPLKLTYQAEVTTAVRVVSVDEIGESGPGDYPADVIPFLFPSRYCQSDKIREEAQELFGHLETPHAIASGVADWIHDNVSYVSGSSGETSSAMDTFREKQGVCRDFAHLGIAFCRALNLPARYATCYAHELDPPDFHACFEVYIGGWWWVFDATRLAPLNGLVRIATGRDAADAAVCTIFGNPMLNLSAVTCKCTDPDFQPVTRDTLAESNQAIALL